MKKLILFILIPMLSRSQNKELLFFSGADSLIYKKVNLSLGTEYRFPSLINYETKYDCNCIANGDGTVFTTKYPYKIHTNTKNSFATYISIDQELNRKLYFQTGLIYYNWKSSTTTKGDSLLTQNGLLHEFKTDNRSTFFDIPVGFEYRINKYFYPVIGITNTFYENNRHEFMTQQLAYKSYTEKGFKITFASTKFIGINIMIPKTNRIYFTSKFIYTSNDWKFLQKHIWYSFGLRLFVI